MPEEEASVRGIEVPRIRTPITMAAAALELERALGVAGVADLNRDMCALLLAQVALETGNGQASDNFQIGNITTTASGTRPFFRPAWFTVDATSSPKLVALHNEMLAGKAPNAFRAYASHREGAEDYARELVRDFPSILTAARTGDALTMAGAIRSSRYTPGINVGAVGASLESLRRSLLAKGLFSTLPKARPAAPAARACC